MLSKHMTIIKLAYYCKGSDKPAHMYSQGVAILGIKNDFLCINICWTPEGGIEKVIILTTAEGFCVWTL